MAKGIFVGLSTIDIVYEVQQFPAPNSKIAAQSQNVYAGGPATNAAVTFAHLGGQSTLVTAIGNHPLSGLMRDEFRKYSIQLIDLNPDFADVPPISSVCIDPSGARNIVSANSVRADIQLARVDPAELDSASILLADGHYMSTCQAWAEAGHAKGIRVVLDGGSWKSGMEKLLQWVHTAVCSADFRPPGCSSEEDVLRYLKDHGVKEIAITHGSDPIRFMGIQESGTVDVAQIQAVDTMGAGDILHGAFCYYVTEERTFPEALRESSRIASESCRFRGTREWMQSRYGK